MYFTLMLHLRSVPSLGLMNRVDMIEYIVEENFVNLQHFLEDSAQIDREWGVVTIERRKSRTSNF